MSGSYPLDESDFLICSYRIFREQYRAAVLSRCLAPYQHVQFPETIPVHLAMFQAMAKEFLREIANELNRLDAHIIQLQVWADILERQNDQKRMILMMEFIDPLATVAFGQPAVLRERFVFALSHTSHQANLQSVDGWTEAKLPADKFIKKKDMKHSLNPWRNSASFNKWFDALDDDWRAKTDGFRNKYQHRIPPRFEQGLTQLVTRNIGQNGRVEYGFGSSQPLSIREFLPLLKQQHTIASRCFSAYSELLREQWATLHQS